MQGWDQVYLKATGLGAMIAVLCASIWCLFSGLGIARRAQAAMDEISPAHTIPQMYALQNCLDTARSSFIGSIIILAVSVSLAAEGVWRAMQ